MIDEMVIVLTAVIYIVSYIIVNSNLERSDK